MSKSTNLRESITRYLSDLKCKEQIVRALALQCQTQQYLLNNINKLLNCFKRAGFHSNLLANVKVQLTRSEKTRSIVFEDLYRVATNHSRTDVAPTKRQCPSNQYVTQQNQLQLLFAPSASAHSASRSSEAFDNYLALNANNGLFHL